MEYRIDIWPVSTNVSFNSNGNTERRFRVSFAGDVIGVWKNPECSAARFLLDRGLADREDMLASYLGGRHALTGRVGWFADRTVDEGGKIRFAKWKPHPGVPRREKTASDGPEVD